MLSIVKTGTGPPSGDASNNSTGLRVESEGIQMKRSINLLHCVSIMFAVTGHISVFVAPSTVLYYTGSMGLSLFIWFAGGIINLFLALCFTELATMLPKAGGGYAYVKYVFGSLPGFMTMWGYLVLISGPFWAFNSYTASLYILQPFYHNCRPPDLSVKFFAAWIMWSLVAVNCVYVKIVTKLQTFLSGVKFLALLLIIVSGAVRLAQGEQEHITNVFEDTSEEPGKVAMAFFFSVFTYGGWQIVTNLMEEVKNPGKDLPRAVFITFAVLTLMFFLTNVAYFLVLSRTEILKSDAVAVLFFQQLYTPLTAVISVFVAITCFGVLNSSILGHSRVLFAGARNKHAPLVFSMISTKYFTPWPAIFVLCIWSLVILFAGDLTLMMGFCSLFSIILSLMVVTCLLYLRWKEPDAHRPYKANILIPISQLILNLLVLMMSIYQEPRKLGLALAILFAGIPIYVIGVAWKSKPKSFLHLIDQFTLTAQKVFVVRKSD